MEMIILSFLVFCVDLAMKRFIDGHHEHHDHENDDQVVVQQGFPIGYKFLPTDEELVFYYLFYKIHKWFIPACVIHDIDASEFYSKPPNKLEFDYCRMNNEQFFFIHHEDDYNPTAANRVVANGNGFWKSNGNATSICNCKHLNVDRSFYALKFSLTYFRGHPSPSLSTAPSSIRSNTEEQRPKKTHWVMEEYHLLNPEFLEMKEKCVLGKLICGKSYGTD